MQNMKYVTKQLNKSAWHRRRAEELSAAAAAARRSTKIGGGGAQEKSAATARRGRRRALHLKRVITRCWTELSQELINGAIDQWARRIDAVIRARGRHIEYLFD